MLIDMKKSLLFIVVIVFMTSCETKNLQIWELVWEDNFDGDAFDTSRWTKIGRNVSEWNKYMSDYDPLYEVSDGQLILRGIVNNVLPDDPAPYLTGGLCTQN
jgi:hypothetical protein